MNSKRSILLQSTLLLVFYHQTLETNAHECIDMNVHAKDVINCCRYEPFCSEEVDEKCNRELSPHMMPGSNNFTVCFIDCAYREMGFITENKNIDRQKYFAFLVGYDKDYQVVTAKAIDNCAAIQKQILQDVDNIPTKCSAFALLFHVCVSQFTLNNCPDDRWSASEICDEVKKGVPLCD